MNWAVVWTVVKEVAQVFGALAPWVTLIFLSRQLRQTDKQIALMREDARRAEQARHDAILPLVHVVSSAVANGQDKAGQPILRPDSNNYNLTLTVMNYGIGTARNVTLSKYTATEGAQALVFAQFLQPGQACPLSTELTLEGQQATLIVTWTDLLGKLFKQEYYLDRTDRFVELWRRAEDGGLRVIEFRGELRDSE